MCVLPKGVVVVWLTGSNQVLVGRFQAPEIVPLAADYQRYYGCADRAIMVKETQAELPAAVQREIETGTISTKKWDDYLLTYSWQVAFNQYLILCRLHLTGFNAERFVTPLTRELATYQ